jgi:hypothetical protein
MRIESGCRPREVVHDLRSPRATPESFKPTNGNGFVFLFFRHEGVSLFSVSLIALLAGTNASSAPVLVVKSPEVAQSPIWQQGSEWRRSTICYVEADMDLSAIDKRTLWTRGS